MDTSGLIAKFLIFILLMAAGYIFARSGYLSREFTQDASKLVINVFMSFTIINSVISMQQDMDLGDLGYAMLLLSASICICYIVAALASRLLPLDREHAPLFEMLTAAPNILFIALPVLGQLFGPVAIFYCSLTGIPYNILLYSYGICRISGSSGGGYLLKNLLSMPLISTVIALLLFLTRLPIPAAIGEFVSTVSNVTMPLSMLIIGASLGSVRLADAFRNWQLYIMSLLRLIITPLIVWLLLSLLTEDTALLMTSVIMAAAPSGITISILTIQFKKDSVYASEGVLLSTVLSMLTTPLLILIFGYI